MSDIPNTAGPWPGWAPGDPWPSSTGAALSPSSLRAELAEAKAAIARLTEERDCYGEQLDERNAIIEAARALEGSYGYSGDVDPDLLDVLIREVRR